MYVCTVCVYVSMTESQYHDAVETLDGERERWEHEMTQYAKVCRYLTCCLAGSVKLTELASADSFCDS